MRNVSNATLLKIMSEYGACTPSIEWVGERNLKQALAECENVDWLWWAFAELPAPLMNRTEYGVWLKDWKPRIMAFNTYKHRALHDKNLKAKYGIHIAVSRDEEDAKGWRDAYEKDVADTTAFMNELRAYALSLIKERQ